MQKRKKGFGFQGQIVHMAPPALRREIVNHPLSAELHALHLGWFPKARGHFMARPSGLSESILIFCVAGRGMLEVSGRETVVERGQVVLIPAGKPHAYAADARDPWSIQWAHYGGPATAVYHQMLPKGDCAVHLLAATARELEHTMELALRNLSAGLNLRSLLLASHALRHALGLIFFKGPKRLGAPAPKFASHDLSTSLAFLRANVSRSVSLREAARQASLSPSRFSAVFKEQTGVSPVDYHIRLRIQAAAQLLDTTNLSIKEIAARLGYEDPYYFSRVFRKVTGFAPLVYRRSVKG
jgi:AraC-like DNA-binding protein